jgi:Family of unknown function (DUF6069)
MQKTESRPAGAVVLRVPKKDDGAVALVAAAAAALVWACARAAGLHLEVTSGSGTTEVNLVSVVVTTMVVAIAGAGLLRVLERRTTRALRVWTIVAVTVWALSLLGPLSATRPVTGLVLAGMHLLVGAVVVLGLRRTHVTVTPVA